MLHPLRTVSSASSRITLRALPVAAAAFACASASAQVKAPAAPASGAASLGAVTITGSRESASTRLPLTVRETPQSVSTVDREAIEQRSLTSVDSVLRTVTGIHTSFYDTQRPLYYARGFQIADFQVDGLPTYSASTNTEWDTALYERVEIVRGANGILTGVGTPSATINLIRKRPKRQFGGSVAASAGRWDYYRAEVDVNAPITADGSVRSRFVVAPQKKHSFRDRYEDERHALMGVVEADLGSATVLSAGYQRQRTEPTAGIWGAMPRFNSLGGEANMPISTNFSPAWTQWWRESGSAFVNLDHTLNERWSVKASYTHTEGKTFSLRTYGYGATTSAAPFPDPVTGAGVRLYAGIGESKEEQDALDVYLSGKFHLIGRDHDLTLGVASSRTSLRSNAFTGVSTWSYTIPNAYTWDGTAPIPDWRRTGASTDQVTRQTGFYASARWRVADPLSVLTGVRVTNWKRQSDAYNTQGIYTGTSARQNVEREPSPFLGVVYDITKNLSVYGSHTGIFNPQNYLDRYGQPLDPVKGTSKELGVKGEWPSLGLTGSLALFEVKQDNYGVKDGTLRVRDASGNLVDAYVGVDGTRSTGWELDLAARLNPQWQATAGITRVRTTRNAADLTYANVPEWQVKLGTQLRFVGALQPLEIGADLQWHGKMVGFNIPSPSGPTTLTQSPVGLLNLNAAWRFNDRLSLHGVVSNALDRRYWATLDYANYGDPRAYSLTLRAKF